jgi:thiosulfate/3-mercaptopyruvate sulfurtransferase
MLPIFLAVLAGAAPAPPAGRARIVTAEELGRDLEGVTVLDAREERAFREGHVPGSRRFDWKDFTLERPGLLSLASGHAARWGKVPPEDAALEERLRALGLSNLRPVVVVGDPRGWGEEGRVAWDLLYWGADDVALLDGGFPSWAAHHPVEKGRAAPVARGDFALHPRPERRIEADELEKTRAGRPLLDARTEEEWNGRRMRGQKRGGRIPGAQLVPYRALYRADGTYVTAGELAKRTRVSPGGTPPAAYCVGGVRSGLLAVLLEARLGVLTRNYDGSMWEWSARKDLPVEGAR